MVEEKDGREEEEEEAKEISSYRRKVRRKEKVKNYKDRNESKA